MTVWPRFAQGTVCKILNRQAVKAHKVRYYLERRDAEFEEKMAQVLCVYREVALLKETAAAAEAPSKPVAVVSYDEKPGIQAIENTAPDFATQARRASELRTRVRVQTPRHAQSIGWDRSPHWSGSRPGQGSPSQP